MKPLSVNKTDLFVGEHHRKEIDLLGNLLVEIESYIDFAALVPEMDRAAPRTVSVSARERFRRVSFFFHSKASET